MHVMVWYWYSSLVRFISPLFKHRMLKTKHLFR